MKRRGNKSSKVPNVKLRPADKGAYGQPVVESCWAEDTQAPADDDSRAGVDTCPRPLADVVICATGITDKPTLFKQAVELGATCTLAFTDRVTHLIAVDHGGAKYTCALERKIPIVRPSWITENYQIWLKGDDVDVDESVRTHRLPIFSGVVVCPSGITDITRRTQIAKLVAAHDGAYRKTLERPVRVTHLLCSGPGPGIDKDSEGGARAEKGKDKGPDKDKDKGTETDTALETDKMRYAAKFNARGEAAIHLVWEEWFWDCLDFGGRFAEALYEVRRPRPERRRLLQQSKGVEEPGHRMHVNEPPPSLSSSLPSRFDEEGPGSSAPRRTTGAVTNANGNAIGNRNGNANANANALADDMDEEPAFARVLPDVTLQLWGGLLGRRGYQVADGEIVLSPSKGNGTGSSKGNSKGNKGNGAGWAGDVDALGRAHSPEHDRPEWERETVNGEEREREKEREREREKEKEKEREKPAFGAARSVLSSFRRANSFAPQETSTARQGVGGMPFRRTATVGAASGAASGGVFANGNASGSGNGNGNNSTAGPSRLPAARTNARTSTSKPPTSKAAQEANHRPEGAAQPPTGQGAEPEPEPQIFAGLRIRLRGEARGAAVRAAIEQRGGVVVGGSDAEEGYDEEGVDYVVVRLVSGSKLFQHEDDPRVRAKYRTECWLEQCLYEDRVCLPSEQIAFVPLGVPAPVPGAEGVVFSFSGFEQSAGHALKRLGRALGITLAPTFNKRATHLLCPSGTGLKFDKAREWGVPVVHMGWLEEMARTGRVPDARGFLVDGPGGAVGGVEAAVGKGGGGAGEPMLPIPPIGNLLDKGKGRALSIGDQGDKAGGALMKDAKRIVENVPPHVEQPVVKKQKQAQALGREATTIVPNGSDPQQQRGTGSRSMLLRNRTASTFDGSGYYVHPSSIPTQSRLPSMPPIGDDDDDGHEDGHQRQHSHEGEEEQEEEETGAPNPSHDLFVPDRSFSLHSLQQQQRQQQHQQSAPPLRSNPQLEAEKSNPNFRIPSSKSPSPMKLIIPGAALGTGVGNGGGGGGCVGGGGGVGGGGAGPGPGPGPAQPRPMRRTNSRGMSLSPVKIDHEAAKALQESITSLLGKRTSADAEDATTSGAGNANANANGNGNGRGAKRARPQRSKAQSRQVSDASIDVGAPARGGGGKGKAPALASVSAISAFESYEEHAHAHGHGHGHGHSGRSEMHMEVEEESMRVLYEDPGQRLEKQRLMDMLKSQNAEEDSIVSGSSSSFTRKSTRRSARIAG